MVTRYNPPYEEFGPLMDEYARGEYITYQEHCEVVTHMSKTVETQAVKIESLESEINRLKSIINK